MNGLFKDEGFCNIATQLYLRLNSASCTMNSYYHYAIFYYDLLYFLATNHNDTYLFWKEDIIAADNIVRELDLYGKEDSDFVHLINSH